MGGGRGGSDAGEENGVLRGFDLKLDFFFPLFSVHFPVVCFSSARGVGGQTGLRMGGFDT